MVKIGEMGGPMGFVIKREVRVCLDQVPGPEWWSELAPRGELSVGISDQVWSQAWFSEMRVFTKLR